MKNAKWIWLDCDGMNQYVWFARDFEAEKGGEAELLIAADSNFAAYVNGELAGFGQFSDFPEEKTFSRISIGKYLRDGNNSIEILAYYCGENFLNHLKGKPGMIAEIVAGGQVVAATGTDWGAMADPAFTGGWIAKVSDLLAFTWAYDSRIERGEITDQAVLTGYNGILTERPVPMLDISAPLETEVVQHGFLHRFREYATPAVSCMRDMLSPRTPKFEPQLPELSEDANGWYVIVDLGRESAGYLDFAIEASAGTVLDIAFGEHLDLGRVRAFADNRERYYADRYICHEGENRFFYPFRRYGCRYLEMHITGTTGPVNLGHLTLRASDLPLPEASPFECGDKLMTETHRVAVRTMELCMHEHYEDCPWREQALYGYDSRNQMLFGYYAWGNYRFAEASLDLLGKSFGRDNLLNLTAPGELGLRIPIFTFAWISALYEHYLYSGSKKPFEKFRSQIDDCINSILARSENGLYLPPPGKHIWNFCEWTPGLDGGEERLSAFYNIYLYEALRNYQHLSGNDYRGNLGRRIEEAFWDESAGAYRNQVGQAVFQDHIQVIMLANGLVPEARRERVFQTLKSGRLLPLSFSAALYLIPALMEHSPEAREWVDAYMQRDFNRMTLSGATSFWETVGGSKDFNGGGSLCHAWSSVPVYFNGACRLGVTPLEPGFKKFRVKIYPGALFQASGSIPTPYGPIQIEWQRNNGKIELNLTHPPELEPQFEEYPAHAILLR